MTIRERDKNLDREYIAKHGHSIHEARWALNPCYDPNEEVPYDPPPGVQIIVTILASVVVCGGFFWLCYRMTR